ncbi:MAG: DMT family transporter [Firmicutes bacterium]|nr:DMT family transporter [Bacillota bacterium]
MDNSTETRFNPYLAVILSVLAVSFGSIFTRLASAPPLVIAFYRLGFTFLLLTPFMASRRWRAEIAAVSRSDLLLAVLSGGFLAAHFGVWITSLSYTSIASSTVLVTMQPLFVVTLGGLLLKEKVGWRSAAGAAIALIGSVVVGAGDFQVGGTAFWGDLLAFAGAFFIAVYVLIGRGLRARLSLLPYVYLVYGTAALLLLVYNLMKGIPLYPYPPMDWLWFLGLAVIPTIMGHTVFNWALRYVRAAVVSVSILGEPVGATILGYLILGEVPGGWTLFGGAIIVLGLYLFISSTREEGEKNNLSGYEGDL